MRSAAGLATAALQEARAGVGSAGAGRMRAWRVHAYGAPADELRLDAARVPPLRAPDELLVKVHSASVNPLDVAMIGGYGRTVLNTLRSLEAAAAAAGATGRGEEGALEFPLVLGRDFYGEVSLAGAGAAARYPPGTRVWGVVPPHWQGSHAEYVIVKDRWAGPAPESLGVSAGGALYAGLTATSLLRAAGLREGARAKRVLLLGLGGVGHAALQLLAADGAERYVTLSSPLLRETDARGLPAGLASAALQLAGQCWAAARQDVAEAVTRVTGRTPPPPAGFASDAGCASLPPHVRWAYFIPSEEDIQLLRRRADRGQLTVPVERVFPWWEGGEALARAAGGHARGKLLIDFTARDPPTTN
ncbi:reticulon-4-interacting protein 1, mitochondrial [Phthorimaea operculella]|nr:reticulon-4-interacting protein 1, mitochondrial [Phthorimaea operculella]